MQETPFKPYLLRAFYEWCTDNGYTPHILVRIDSRTRVPRQFASTSEIALNISFDATHQLKMGNDRIEFKARFAGVAHQLDVPVRNVLAIYAQENGQGITFPAKADAQQAADGLPRPADTALPATDKPLDQPAIEALPGDKPHRPNKESKASAKNRRAHLRIIK